MGNFLNTRVLRYFAWVLCLLAGTFLVQTKAMAATSTTIIVKHSGQCLDVRGGVTATANGVPLEQWPCTGQSNESFTLKDMGSGLFSIAANNSGKCVEVANSSTADGAAVQQMDCSAGKNQLWSLNLQSDGNYQVVSANSGKCLDLTGSSMTSGALVEQWTCTGQANQAWALTLPDVVRTLTSTSSGKCFDVRGGPTATQDGAAIEQWSCTGQTNQQWTLKDTGHSQFQLVANHSGKCLDLISGNTADGALLQQATCTTSATQKWLISSLGNAKYKVVHASSGKCVDVTGNSTSDGTSLQLLTCNGLNNQSWAVNNAVSAPVVGSPSTLQSVNTPTECLDVTGGTTATQDGATIEQWTCTGQSNENWTFRDMGNAQYEVIAGHSNKCLEVIGGSTAAGAKQQQATCNGSAGQLWTAHGIGGGKYELHNVNSNLCLGIVGSSHTDGALTEQNTCNLGNQQLWTFGAGSVTSQPSPYGQDPNLYTLAFADEFENGFNSSIWTDHVWYESSNPTKNYTVENGSLKVWPMLDSTGHYFDRAFVTDGTYYQTYGYFEIEAKLPFGYGTWPAFWLFNHIGTRRPEIDIMEAWPGQSGGWGQVINGQYHPVKYAFTVWQDAGNRTGYAFIPTPDLSAAFHKYGLKWEPNKITAYFDGQAVGTVTGTMSDPMYIILDLWFGNTTNRSLYGNPDPNNTGMQGKANSYEIKYVRAWQFK